MRLDLPDLTDGEIWIWNGVGQMVGRQDLNQGIINTQHLADGMYHGIGVSRDKAYKFSFIKQK